MTWVSGLFAISVALITLQIWFAENVLSLDEGSLNRELRLMPPINLYAFLCLILSGVFLLSFQRPQVSRAVGRKPFPIGKVIATVIIIFAFIALLQGMTVFEPRAINRAISGSAISEVSSQLKLPLNLTLSFLLLGVGLLSIDKETKRGHIPAQYLGFVVFILAFFSLLSVIYEFMFVGRTLVYALSAGLTAISLIVLACGVFCAQPDKGVMAILRSESSGGVLARHLFPSAIFIPLLLGGLIFLGLQAGYYDAILGLAILSVTQIIIFQTIFWRNSLLIHQLDEKRDEVRQALRSENVKLSARIKEQAAEIEAKSRELSQALTAKQRIQEALSHQTESTNQIKNEFLAVVSHELRSPLNSILGWATMLKSGQLTPELTARALDSIERSARSQNLLINDLLDMSMLISGKLRLRIRPIDPKIFVREAIESVRPLAEEKRLTLNLELDEIGEQVSGDAERLQQVVRILIANAIKFTPPSGSISVKLKARKKSVVVSVADTGVGISSEFLPQVFELFRQAENSHTRIHGGLGVGLSLARQLVELHDGMIGVDSLGEGKGATFFLELPRQFNPWQDTQN
jgi:signal transduction histidine kinase